MWTAAPIFLGRRGEKVLRKQRNSYIINTNLRLRIFHRSAGCSHGWQEWPGSGHGRKDEEDSMHENGVKITAFIKEFGLEVLNRGSDFESAMLTITDVNRPGLDRKSVV